MIVGWLRSRDHLNVLAVVIALIGEGLANWNGMRGVAFLAFVAALLFAGCFWLANWREQ